MEIGRYEHRHLDLICELDDSGLAVRADEWADLKRQARQITAIPGGVRISLPAQSAEQARDLARREALCCGFLDITVNADDNEVRLDIVSAGPAAAPLFNLLDGLSPVLTVAE